MKLHHFFLLFLLYSIISAGSCRKIPECEEFSGLPSSELRITFIDSSTDKYMYEEIQYGSLYKKDSLKVFLEDGAPVLLAFSRNRIPNTIFAYYVIGIGNIVLTNSDIIEDGTEKSRKFYIQYNHIEKDTITTVFKVKKLYCGSVFNYLKVYYRNKLIGTFYDTVFGDITIKKP